MAYGIRSHIWSIGHARWLGRLCPARLATLPSCHQCTARLQVVKMHRTPSKVLFMGVKSCVTAPQMWIWGKRRIPTCGAPVPPLSPYRVHAWHCPSAPRTPLDPLRAVGAVQAGAAVRAEVVACLYVDHRVSAHGALLSLVCRHTRYAGIRFILLILAGTALVAAAIRLTRAPVPRSPPTCLDRRRTLPPRLREAAELKFLPTKCTFHPVHFSADRWRISHAPTHKIALAA